jgi:hypothetical protein
MAHGRRRGWLVPGLILLVVVIIAAWWVGPGGTRGAQLELLLLDANSRFSADARLAAADPTAAGPPRFPLIFAVRNTGVRPASPTTLSLSVPGWVRLLRADGTLRPVDDEGETLVRYLIPLQGEPFEPGALPLVPGGLERLWLAADLSSVSCARRWDGVVEFVATPDYDRARLATITAFYAIAARNTRYTGTLNVRLDPERIIAGDERGFSVGETTVRRPAAMLPAITLHALEGVRTTTCGAPEIRVPLTAVVWRTSETTEGRFIVVLQDGAPRRVLYDTDGDGRIEFEAWDGDADGQFEGAHSAAFAIPPFLLPLVAPAPPPDSAAAADSLRTDSLRTDSLRADSAPRRGGRGDSGRGAPRPDSLTRRGRGATAGARLDPWH